MFNIYVDLKKIYLCISYSEGCIFDLERKD